MKRLLEVFALLVLSVLLNFSEANANPTEVELCNNGSAKTYYSVFSREGRRISKGSDGYAQLGDLRGWFDLYPGSCRTASLGYNGMTNAFVFLVETNGKLYNVEFTPEKEFGPEGTLRDWVCASKQKKYEYTRDRYLDEAASCSDGEMRLRTSFISQTSSGCCLTVTLTIEAHDSTNGVYFGEFENVVDLFNKRQSASKRIEESLKSRCSFTNNPRKCECLAEFAYAVSPERLEELSEKFDLSTLTIQVLKDSNGKASSCL